MNFFAALNSRRQFHFCMGKQTAGSECVARRIARVLEKSPLFAIEQIDLPRTSDFSTLRPWTPDCAAFVITTGNDFPKTPDSHDDVHRAQADTKPISGV
jgi:hypothetical protein